MTRLSALMLAVGVAAAVWMALPIARPEFAAVWFVGAGPLKAAVIHGRDVLSAAAGLAVWIGALHFPERPKHIWFRRGSAGRFA